MSVKEDKYMFDLQGLHWSSLVQEKTSLDDYLLSMSDGWKVKEVWSSRETM